MCSLNEGDSLIVHTNNLESNWENCFCLKCKTKKASVKLRGSDVYCNMCFMISVTHKFRATLGKLKIVRPTDKILIAHSGYDGSITLLHLIKAGMHESVHKRILFDTKVVHIDDGFLFNQSVQERQFRIEMISRQSDYLDFPIYTSSLGEVLSDENVKVIDIKRYLCTTNHNESRLIDIHNKISDKTSRKDFLRRTRDKLIVLIAKDLGCGKIFLASDSTSLAVTILSNVSMGRGAQLSSDVGFIDDRHSDFMILRPMRDFSRQELNYYMDIHTLKTLTLDKSKENPYESIQELTEQFVVGLDRQFGGTVSTIFRTGEKLSSKRKNLPSDEETCVMCNGILDTSFLEDATSAIEATNFSRLVSVNGSVAQQDLKNIAVLAGKITDSNVKKCTDCKSDCCGSTKEGNLIPDEIRKCLCYGCRTIFIHKNNELELYPLYVIKSVRERIVLNSMRDEIKDFLL